MEYINLEKITHCDEFMGTLDESFVCEYCGLPIIEDTKNPDSYFFKILNKLIMGTISKAEEKDLLYLLKHNTLNYKNIDVTSLIVDKVVDKKLTISYITELIEILKQKNK